MEAILSLEGVRFGWQSSDAPTLDIPSFSLNKGERLLLQGPSGSGKTTLLNLLSGVALPQQGSVRVLGRELNCLSERERDRFRADHLGVVFQQFNLLPYLSILQNVTLPLSFSTLRKERAKAGASQPEAILKALDIPQAMLTQSVDRLSVGQQQRVALARAMVGAPEIIIADEPTSALDIQNRERFLELLFSECELLGSTLIMVSHDESISGRFSRVVRLESLQGAAHV